MKQRFSILLTLAALLLLPLSCHRVGPESGARLDVLVYIPAQELTRGETGSVTADPMTERMVYDLRIWIFNHQQDTLIGYLEPSVNNLQSGTQEVFSIYIDDATATAKPNLDVYVLANGPAGGINLGATATSTDLKNALLSGSYFSTSPLTGSVPEGGLPMSGFLANKPMTGTGLSFSVSTVQLKRLVSKLRFVFCGMAEETDGNLVPVDDFTVVSITLNGGVIPNSEYVFNTSEDPYSVAGGYAVANVVYSGPPSIASNAAPGDYIYDSGKHTAQQYEDLINTGIASGLLTEWGRTYFRESDKQLSGTIRYGIGTGAHYREKSAPFEMAAAGDFARNHSWIIYGYFLGGKLILKPVILPWLTEDTFGSYDYITQGDTKMEYEEYYLRYDIDKEANTWNDTWMCTAYGYESGGNDGRPIHAKMITITTLNSSELRVQLTNDEFMFVRMTPTFDGGGQIISRTYTKSGQSITISPSGTSQKTYFYVVPVSAAAPSDPYVKVILTEIHGGGLPPENIPFNHNLPGDEDHTSILLYNPGAATYSANLNNDKVSGSTQPYQYWIEP